MQECIGFLQSTSGTPETMLSTWVGSTLNFGDAEREDLYAADGTVSVCH